MRLSRIQSFRAEWLGGHPVDHQLQIDVVIGEVHDVEHFEARRELPSQYDGVIRPCPERHESAGISEHRVANVVLQLVKVLVRENKSCLVLTELRDHPGDAERGEGLELVHVEEEGTPFLFDDVCTAEGGEPAQALHRDDEMFPCTGFAGERVVNAL